MKIEMWDIEENKTMIDIKSLVAFCILMENDNGILDKAPIYILEKFSTCMAGGRPLDSDNMIKYKKWMELWERKGGEG